MHLSSNFYTSYFFIFSPFVCKLLISPYHLVPKQFPQKFNLKQKYFFSLYEPKNGEPRARSSIRTIYKNTYLSTPTNSLWLNNVPNLHMSVSPWSSITLCVGKGWGRIQESEVI